MTGRSRHDASGIPPGAWAKPLCARKHHYFCDGSAHALCGAYATRDVQPSEFGTAAQQPRCPTCERKLGYDEPGLEAQSVKGADVREAVALLHDRIERFVPDGFRDEDGVWWDGPHLQACRDALDAISVALAAAEARAADAERERDEARLEWPASVRHFRQVAAAERARADKATEALERLVADLETNTEAGAPAYAHDALRIVGEALA